MKRTFAVALLAGLLAALPAVTKAEEEAAELGASLDLPVLNAYVWRGQVLNDEAVLQPSLTVSKGGFAINWWANFNLTDNATGDDAEFSEHDISVSYSKVCPYTGADMTIGVVNYDFPNPLVDAEGNPALVNDTREAYFVAAFSEVLLAPTLSIYYDFKEADGFYGSLGISHSIEVSDTIALDLSASLGAADSSWGEFYYSSDDVGDGLNDASVGATLPIVINDNWTITPGVSYVALLDDASDAVDAAGDALYSGETEYVVGSLKASYTF
jgi:hypothetical protein